MAEMPLTRPAVAQLATISPERMLDRFVEIIESALREPDARERLSQAGVVVRIDVVDIPGGVVTLLLEPPTPELAVRSLSVRPDVRLYLRSADLEEVLAEGEYLPLQILAGAVTFDGHIRKFLRVLPILRHAAEDAARARVA